MISNYERGWKTLGRKDAETLYNSLKEIRRTATMETADFTNKIKEETLVWRQSWILHPLDTVIAQIKQTYKFKN
jgi:hypothetical protein